jgi:RNA polymerase sigma factor (sigma-70 family)
MLMVGDEAQLYVTLAPRVERIVSKEIHAPREVIEDACHHAWTKLINNSERISRESALPWLVTTAVRQAWRLDRQEQRELSLEAVTEETAELPVPSRLPGPAESAEVHERLRSLETLSDRQQRLVWLRAMGLSHVEMAAYTGDTVRTVQRQINRATAQIRQLREQQARQERERPGVVRGPQRFDLGPRSLGDRGLER